MEVEQLLKSVAANIRTFRKRKGISQNELSRLIDCSVRYIQRIETQPANLSLESLSKIADALEVSVVDLIGQRPKAKADEEREGCHRCGNKDA